MKRLAIISSYSENCGNASYTHVLKKAFGEFVEVDILSLDLFLLQKKADVFRKPANSHIKKIAARLKDYDYVNIQFEAGLYGATIPDIRRRIGWLIAAAPNLILTMHRIDVGQLSLKQALSDSVRRRSTKPYKGYRGSTRFAQLYRDIVRQVQKQSKQRNAWIKVHTKRERRVVTEIFRFDRCFDFPLGFLTPEERNAAWAQSDRRAFFERHGFESGDKIVGLFGYISEYKGIETAMQSLHDLPSEYKLAFFGSHHPQSYRPHTPLHPYLESLIELMGEVDDDNYGQVNKVARIRRLSQPQIRLVAPDEKQGEAEMPTPMSDRVRFIGSLPDPEFIEALRLSDAVVLPYIEVGQSMSGVVMLGMEAGARMVCANNYSFTEVRKYFPETFLGFDMGNYVELAQKVEFCAENPNTTDFRDARDVGYDKYNIRSSVMTQLERFGHQF